MKSFYIRLQFASTTLLASLLSACGGGGGDAPAPAPVAATTKIYGQVDAKAVAGLGFLTNEFLFLQTLSEHAFFASLIQGYSTEAASGSSPAVTESCATGGVGSGSITVSTSKAGVYVGLQTNDSLSFAFDACDFGDGVLLGGNAVIVSKGNYANLPANFLVQYGLTTNNFDINLGKEKLRSNGVQSVKFDGTVAGTSYPEVTSTVGTSYAVSLFSPLTTPVPKLAIGFNAGASLYAKYTATNTFVSKVDGVITASTSTGDVPLSLSTAVPLSGSVTGGRPIPTAGTLRVKSAVLNLQTETMVQGTSAQLKADSNGDGTLDLTFNTTYIALTAF
jgi:hypothetical protein